MAGIVLSAAVRQNLLALQSTASLLATTQNDLSTGKKVNSALDNPTNFFTALGLDNRASDISNLLDGIGNGVQVLQAANTGITALQQLIDSAKSVANQALQTAVGYSQKSSVSTSIPGATSSNLLGTTTFVSATATSNVIFAGTAAAGGPPPAPTPAKATSTLGAAVASVTGTAAITGGGTTSAALLSSLTNGPVPGDVLTVNGHTVTFEAGAAPATPPSGFTQVTAGAAGGTTGSVFTDANGDSEVFLGAAGTTPTVGDLLTAIDLASGVQSVPGAGTAASGAASANPNQTASSIAAGVLTLKSSTGADLNITGRADLLNGLKLTPSAGPGSATVTATRATAPATLGSLITDGSTLTVDGHTITFKNGPTPAGTNVPTGFSTTNTNAVGVAPNGNVITDGNGNSTVFLQNGTVQDVLNAIDLATGVQNVKSVAGGVATLQTASGQAASTITTAGTLSLSTGVNADLSITGSGNAFQALGLTGNTGNSINFTAPRTAGPGGVAGKTLTFTSLDGGTPVNVTFGTGVGQIQSLNDLNTALQADNLTATVDGSGKLTISATDSVASATIGSAAAGGAIGGTLTTALTFSAATTPVPDAAAQAARAALVSQYNNILQQITTTAHDSSFNGINVINGDQLKLTFNESGTSVLNITGSTLDAAGLGLSNLTSGVDFIDNNATNKVLDSLSAAGDTLRSQASTLGSNLSVVEIRQDFNKNLINVLQTGSANLTVADTNEEAANEQALSTRQSIAVSALSLANQSQQSVLQLLR
jgi:hypothetical protein